MLIFFYLVKEDEDNTDENLSNEKKRDKTVNPEDMRISAKESDTKEASISLHQILR